MLRDNLVELIEPMLNSAGANPLALTHHQIQASGDRLPCLENPRPKGAESSLTENVTSPFQAEPAQLLFGGSPWTPTANRYVCCQGLLSASSGRDGGP
jgi:hypothetical protein